jgi:hypothetical protein
VAHPQPERSELYSTVGDSAPITSVADAHPGVSPGAVWLTVCAWCGRRKVRDRWIDAPHDLEIIDSAGSRQLRVTHGICSSCFDEAARRRSSASS